MNENELEGSELFIGLVGAVGTDLTLVSGLLQEALTNVAYASEEIRLISGLGIFPQWINIDEKITLEQRYDTQMTAGTDFRTKTNSGDSLALLAISGIREIRQANNSDENIPLRPCLEMEAMALTGGA